MSATRRASTTTTTARGCLCLAVGLAAAACGYRSGLVDETFSTEVLIDGISPRSASTASSETPVTLFGRNFVAGSEVYFGDSPAEVLSGSERELQLRAPGRGPGEVPVRLVLPDGREIEGPVFRYRAAELRLRFAEEVGPSGAEAAYGVGDVDGDGRQDLVIAAQRGSVGRLSVHRGTDRGLDPDPLSQLTSDELPAALDYVNNECLAVGQPKYDLAVADLDADGRAEVALTLYRQPRIELFEQPETPGEDWTRRELDDPRLFEPCHRRQLVPLDTDPARAGHELLAVINYGGPAPFDISRPPLFGRLGYTALDGRRSGALDAKALGCERLHSHRVQRAAGVDRLLLLCDRLVADGSSQRELRLVELDFAGDGVPRVSARTVLPVVPDDSRLHLFELDDDPGPEVISLSSVLRDDHSGYQLELARGDLDGAGALQLDPAAASYDLDYGGPPLLAVTDVVGTAQPYIVLLWPQRQGEMTVLDRRDPNPAECLPPAYCGTPSVNQTALALLPGRPMLPLDWANTSAFGTPATPSLQLADLDGDGRTDWITADKWGQTLIAYGSEKGPRALPPWRQLAAPAEAPATIWPETLRPASHDGRQLSALVDLDGDGTKDLASLQLDYHSEPQPQLLLYLERIGAAAGRWLKWPAPKGLPASVAPAFGDVDGDGWADLLVPTTDDQGQLVLGLVRSGGKGLAGYAARPAGIPSLSGVTALALLPVAANGDTRARLLLARECATDCPGSGLRWPKGIEPQAPASELRAFEWAAKDAKLVEVALGAGARGWRLPGGAIRHIARYQLEEVTGEPHTILHVLTSNWSCAVDVTDPQRTSCVQRCETTDCQQSTFGADQVAFDGQRRTVSWLKASAELPRSVSLVRPEGTFSQPRFEAMCDLDGDNHQEVIFSARLQGHTGPVLGALSWDPDTEELAVQLVGSPTFAFGQVDCLQGQAPGDGPAAGNGSLEDLVLRAADSNSESSYYLVHNRSR